MKAKFRITNPDVAECTLIMTMPLAAWKKLREQLTDKYPSWHLRSTITQLVSKAEYEFEAEEEFES